MFEELREKAYLANMRLTKENLIKFTWGNASEIDREKGVMAIKPSGVAYESLSPENMVLIDIETGKQIEKGLRPSSDSSQGILTAEE